MGPMWISSFFFVQTLMQGLGLRKAVEEVQKKFIPVYKNNLKVWPVVSFLNFKFVDPLYQILVVSSFAIIWNAYLSYMKYTWDKQQA